MAEKERKPNKVYESIKEDILHMKIKPGETIGEIDIAASFGVSRTPVRDAFKKLEADGLAADYHPSETTHQKAAEKLAAYIRQMMQW